MNDKNPTFLIVDLFCGAGGVTNGFVTSGVAKVIAAINHDHVAILSHQANHPDVKHFEEDITKLDLGELYLHVIAMRKKYPTAKLVLHASLECTNFSKAKGGLAREADSRTLAIHLYRYIETLNPDYITIENVVEFRDWGPIRIKVTKKHKKPYPHWDLSMINNKHGEKVYGYAPIQELKGQDFDKWREHICKKYGYRQDWTEINSADLGARTSRNRLFGIFAKDNLPIAWPVPTHAKKPTDGLKKWEPVKPLLDLKDEGKSIFDRKKPLAERSLERIHAGLVKFVAGGKDAYAIKTRGVSSTSPGLMDIDEPSHTLTTQIGLNYVTTSKPLCISRYYGGNPESRNTPLTEPCRVITTENRHSLINIQVVEKTELFISKYYSGDPDSKNTSPLQPCSTITTKDHNSVVFISRYHIHGQVDSIENPLPTIATKDQLAIIRAHFIKRDFTTGDNTSSLEQPAGSILSIPKLDLITTCKYLINYHHSSDANSIEEPNPTLTTKDKYGMITPFIAPTHFNNTPQGIEEPLGTITANRKWHYLVNPGWGGNNHSVNSPAPVVIARQDKAPLSIIIAETGQVAIRLDDNDSPMMRKIKVFMAIYGLSDIKMRMLKVTELLRIQGFPKKFILAGSQEQQKKFIGNAVVPLVVEKIAQALHDALEEYEMQMAA